MSGGERKKRGCDRGQGWEEAGAEFYQESYPAAAIEADLQQALQRDPSHIATLLPSKKSRVGKGFCCKRELYLRDEEILLLMYFLTFYICFYNSYS